MARLRIAIAIVLALFLLGLSGSTFYSLPFYPQGNQYIQYSVPTEMKYTLNVYNATSNHNSSALSLIERAIINYNVRSINGTWVNVLVTSNYTKVNNISFISSGNFTINYALSPLNLDYPYLFPGFLSNSTSYAIKSNSTTLILSFVNMTNVSGVSTFIYKELSPTSLTLAILPNGVVSSLNQTSSGLTFNMNLLSYQNSSYLKSMNFTNRPGYLYVNLTFSRFSMTYQPSGYLEYVYPSLLPGNILLMSVYNIQFYQGAKVGGYDIINSQPVNFIINVGSPNELVTNFVSIKNNTAYWNSSTFQFVGNVTKNIQGTTYNLQEYSNNLVRNNVTVSKTILYVEKNMIVEEDYNQTIPNVLSYKLELINSSYINPDTSFPDLTGYFNSTLPFKAINPSGSFTIAVIVTLVVVAILVILHRR
ncbi:MAG: hypothetical protein QW253_00580 [Metallosphaera sp.]|uniref:hypothetical protein n=1 Tax=Metallosphaera sp. TaxID=2020860 RepID=UPI003169CE37